MCGVSPISPPLYMASRVQALVSWPHPFHCPRSCPSPPGPHVHHLTRPHRPKAAPPNSLPVPDPVPWRAPPPCRPPALALASARSPPRPIPSSRSSSTRTPSTSRLTSPSYSTSQAAQLQHAEHHLHRYVRQVQPSRSHRWHHRNPYD